MKYVYLITSPSGKRYVGQSKILVEDKIKSYVKIEKHDKSNRKITNAIKKYGWENMIFEVIEKSNEWTDDFLNQREIYWISYYNSVQTGYNMTAGGDGVDSECARQNALNHHNNMSEQKKKERSQNCSIGQKARFRQNPESDETKQKKSESHKGSYVIESPDGRVWGTSLGLKEFADTFKNEIQMSYWQLFSAYRKCYNNTTTLRKRKDNNNWKVIRIDKPNS